MAQASGLCEIEFHRLEACATLHCHILWSNFEAFVLVFPMGNDVYNRQGEDLGDIKEIMLDVLAGRVSYAVLSCGGLLGMGEKLFAVPWAALKLDTDNKRFTLDVSKDRLENAPGFDKDSWPNMADPAWENGIHSYYGTTPSAD